MLLETYKDSAIYKFMCSMMGYEIDVTPYEHLFFAINDGDYDGLIDEVGPEEVERLTDALDRRFAAMLKYIAIIESDKDLQYHSHKPLYVSLLRELVEKKDGMLSGDDVVYVLGRANSRERWDLFAYYIVQNYALSPEAFAKGLKSAWDSGVYDEAQVAIQLFGMADPAYLMDEKEKALYDALPDRVEIYRGTSRFENDGEGAAGLSWTIDRGVAEFFAFRGRSHAESDGRVYVAEVFKEDIIVIIEDRGEREVILSEEGVESVLVDGDQSILTEKKTEFYDRYIQEK